MNYHTLYQISNYLNNNKVDIITSLNKYNQGYKNTYLYKPLHIRVHYKNIEKYLNRNYKLEVYGINTLEELKEVIEYNVDIVGIEFARDFDSYVDANNLPKTLKFIVFGRSFNQSVDNLPQTLISIKFGYCFNKNVDNLPKKLRIIKFGVWFNQTVDNLPPTVKFIIFGRRFNKSVDKLPQSLKSIIFGEIFNRPVDNLPEKLRYVVFDYWFNQNVDKLPQSLELITFGENFYQSLKNLPKTVKKIKLHATAYIHRIELQLPPNVCVERYGNN